MSSVVYHLVGYSRRIGGRVVDEHEIPVALKPWAKKLAHVATDSPQATMRYPLDNWAARNLAEEAGIAADTASNQYFLEVFSV